MDGLIKLLCHMASHNETITAETNTPKPEITEQDPLKKKLMEMLTESTGCDILDSGGDMGRHWQKNRMKDFNNEYSSFLEVSTDENGKVTEFYVTHNVFHWLNSMLELPNDNDPVLKVWNDMKNDPEHKEDGWYCMMQDFPGYFYDDDMGRELTGLYGEGKCFSVNTFNGEDSLSQTLQYEYFEYEGIQYVLLQIHNGADVRGGYTEPVLFILTDECSIFRNADATLRCSNDDCDASWYTDDAWNWYSDMGESDLKNDELMTDKKTKKNIICPDCKKGILEPSF